MGRRKILIVGAGQSGLQLAHGLQQHDYDVTVMTSQTPEEVRAGRVRSTQAMFAPALQHERDLGLNFWDDDAPTIGGMHFSIPAMTGGPGPQGLNFVGRLEGSCRSVDQRIKMCAWLLDFARRAAREDGRGRVIIGGATGSDLEYMTRHEMYDLIVVAAGRGGLARMFMPDIERTCFKKPQRHLSVTYVRGLKPDPDFGDADTVNFNLIPGLGELLVLPALTTTGPCHILFFEAIPGGELDRFTYRTRTGAEHLKLTLELMKQHTPRVYQRARDVELTDWGGFLTGSVTPVVRHPVGRPGQHGGPVLGMADAVLTNDPITGQGSNNAAHCAAVYLQAILDQGGKPFDEEWMQRTWDVFWSTTGKAATTWTNAMLQQPQPHVARILTAADRHHAVADRLANGFANPSDLHAWFMDPDKASAYLSEVTGAPRGS
ncbi:FAD-binding oxidoreductase [Streptomyces sp. N2-109]|uniref:FAD-binding oxidoreductase n=1 Tax=Streptomyces gossypii TaxID=2883101 RepID=A0ABT2JVW9_9ACTN|nr:styrene monooxygenase/indole monooxygenase family protein [Streptomyces gossypii]MCT2592043.1 FAD-binding oxidoreductase [Streptomyces gossypii]